MLQLHSILPQTLTEFYHENLILEQLGEFYRCNPMLVTSCCILGLLYIYYSLRVAGVPELHCRRGTSLHRSVFPLLAGVNEISRFQQGEARSHTMMLDLC